MSAQGRSGCDPTGPPASAEVAGTLRRPEIRAAMALWGMLAIAVSVKILVAPGEHTVFPKFAEGSVHWWARQPLYARYEGFGPFRYSPTFAVAMTPFSLFGLRIGGLLWSWVNIAVFVWGVRRLVRDVLPGAWPPNREMMLLMLSLLVAFAGVWNGQSSPLAGGLLMGACSGLSRKKVWWCASLLAAAVAIKLPLLIPALLLAAVWPRQLAVRLSIALVVAAAVPFLTASPTIVFESYIGWHRHLTDTAAVRWPSFRDAWTVWQYAAGTVNVYAYRWAQLLAGVAALAWCLWLRRQLADGRDLLTLTLAAGLAYLMVFGPVVEGPTYAIIAPVVAWAVIESVDGRLGRPLALLGACLIVPLGFGVVQRGLGSRMPILTMALPAGTALVAAWCVWYARRCPRVRP